MSKLDYSQVTESTERKLLDFLNRAWRVQDILSLRLVKDAEEGRDYGIGPTLARRILEKRRELPARRFRSIMELDDIPGLGQEKLDGSIPLR